MGEPACTCDDPDLVTVKDRNMAKPYVAGNPYSRYCRNCKRRYFCADSFWEKAKEKFVIGLGADEPVHVDDYDEENFFECPECDKPHFGMPSGCDCGADYEWNGADND